MARKKQQATVRRPRGKKEFKPGDHQWGIDPDPQTNARIAEVIDDQFTRRDYPVEGGDPRNMWIVSWEFLIEKLWRGKAQGDYRFTTWLIDHPGKPARRADDIVQLIVKRKLVGKNAPKPGKVLFGTNKAA